MHLALLLSAALLLSGTSIVTNGGCESATDNFPDVWRGNFRCAAYDRDVEAVPSGEAHYFRAEFSGETPKATSIQAIPVSGGGQYTLSANVGTFIDAISAPDITLRVRFLDANGKELSKAEAKFTKDNLPPPTIGRGTMKPMTLSGSIPADAKRVELRIDAGVAKTGTAEETAPALVDNVILVMR